MNLRLVHAVLIFLSAALAALFGLWCLRVYGEGGGSAMLASALAAFAVSAGLLVYDRWFLRKTRMLR